MTSKIILLGVPGLYQNWLRAAVDPASTYTLSYDHNFLSTSNSVTLISKLTTNIDSINGTVINTTVSDRNFVWFLYNYFEKTSGIGVKINNLIAELTTKAYLSVPYTEMLDHINSSYKITSSSTPDYIYNSFIEYFYFNLIKPSIFRQKLSDSRNGFIDVEYDDFSNQDRLIEKFSMLPKFNADHFIRHHKLLVERNEPYLNKKAAFLVKIKERANNFNILELSYIGALLYWNDKIELDWFNREFRMQALSDRHNDIYELAHCELKV